MKDSNQKRFAPQDIKAYSFGLCFTFRSLVKRDNQIVHTQNRLLVCNSVLKLIY